MPDREDGFPHAVWAASAPVGHIVKSRRIYEIRMHQQRLRGDLGRTEFAFQRRVVKGSGFIISSCWCEFAVVA
jgi:hypothetical protein